MKQKGEFYKVKKSGFSMLLLLICVSMLSVMPVSAARKNKKKIGKNRKNSRKM